jgi:hypothetical protein
VFHGGCRPVRQAAAGGGGGTGRSHDQKIS